MIRLTVSLAALALGAGAALADENHAIDQENAVKSAADQAITASFDILAAHATRNGQTVTFRMTTNGVAGADTPEPAGQLGGAPVLSYVWPTSLDPSAVGFEGKTGILAFAATSHPDFDDTPLFDEDADGDPANDGTKWHSHWVVLTPTEACGEGALGVRDIPEGETPALPPTWPGLPIFIDSPGYTPVFDGPEIAVTVPFAAPVETAGISYDGVTSALRVHANIHAPLLCVTDVFDIASGDLSLPGRVE
ncbi:hypothetical protein SAMN04487972_10659 [Paracoccus halophilus]|uniref:Uncharacterized protein n=1 Tax=Paracoccus halophilus TaxID=376733 RepID=A0A099F504_9RHOB|nr:hypothetical protein [Paracoccus halophilus]KGJ05353.1 hypothetical protein IT41_06150 [Paracoccus halophilus]SFA48825.1 hypothetical protein SAMN04487972_10659 [Paracoccus halophilus]